MNKHSHPKKLYQLNKLQKKKQSASTNDLNDSLDLLQSLPPKHHLRTHSCPFSPPLTLQEPTPPPKEQTTRIHQFKPSHRNCRSQQELDNLSVNQHSISIDALSSVLYRKNSKESTLKKSRISGGTSKFKGFTFDRDHHQKMRVNQQIKKYELSQQLMQLEKKSKGITMKQHILQSLLTKFDQEFYANSQDPIQP